MSWRDYVYIAWLAFVSMTMAVLLTLAVFDYKTCEAKGGEFVRGIVWFKCVEKMK